MEISELHPELHKACQKGDADSKKVIEILAPHMAATLMQGKQ